MLTLQKTGIEEIVSMQTAECNIENLLTREWLLTNNRGGYAASTIIGCNTRRYHGLLVGSLNPPVNRIMALANCIEMVICPDKVFNLSTFEFDDKFAPAGFNYLKRFRRNIGAHFDYRLDSLEVTKSVYLAPDADTVALVYDFKSRQPLQFVLRPFIGLRNFHSLQKSYAQLSATQSKHGLLIRHDLPKSCQLTLNCASADFEKDQQWWFNFVYRTDRERGQDFTEDLWTPGFFKCHVQPSSRVIFWANLSDHRAQDPLTNVDLETVIHDLTSRRRNIIKSVKTRDKKLDTLVLAADQFVSKRQLHKLRQQYLPPEDVPKNQSHDRTTILAGFPWFADWGRDAFIALPGLLLSAHRFDEAKSVLTTFAATADEGMIPNRFDDRSDTACFNSIDASLWFINAAFLYFDATDDFETFTTQLLPTICAIIDAYHNGTRFGIHADNDGLITAGSKDTQLTWMDAKYDGIAFTPRFGKAVEINALWYNSLLQLARFCTNRDNKAAHHYRSLAEKVRSAFCRLFWNRQKLYLNDCILPDGSVDDTLRPNQIFAVALTFSPLSAEQQNSVVNVVRKELLTPFGLRTLAKHHSSYKSIYTGPQKQRDEAYHQGTVWPWLMGPFVTAYLKVNESTRKARKEAAGFIQPLIKHLSEDGCLGQVCEIFDADPPHKPKGCFAQAWSVAELIRAYQLINS